MECSYTFHENCGEKICLRLFLLGLALTPSKLCTTRLFVHPDTDAPFHEHVLAVEEEPTLQLSTCEMSLWNASRQNFLFTWTREFQDQSREEIQNPTQHVLVWSLHAPA